jgi:hypothetical protein
MKNVYVLHHSYELEDCEETKLIGVYSSKESAKQAITRLKTQSGFCDHPNNFSIDRYQIDQDNWEDGFTTMVTVYMPLLGEGINAWRPVQAIKRTDGFYKITSHNDDPEDENWSFSNGDIVRCEPKVLNDGEEHLVIIEKEMGGRITPA